ncbi:hypothetical protein V9T40_012612 [Parthenolecanium corni]|uniref:Sodium/potassium-transporting ATPase subunit beta-2 n=1 Tax=Parthenolecanium corni TaxID=536013 RepID=A0AAN9T975_9HEMI
MTQTYFANFVEIPPALVFEIQQLKCYLNKNEAALLLFYAIFYSVLALLFTLCMKVLLSTLNDEYPKFQLGESIIGASPGLGYRPMATDTEAGSIIWYNKTTKNQWITTMKEFVDKNYKSNSSYMKDCRYGDDLLKDEMCRVSMDSFGKCAPDYGYGFGLGQPCVFIKLNRIYGWVPEFYNNSKELPSEIPDNAKEAIKNKIENGEPNYVWVSCNGQSPHDRENQGPIEYIPAPGFPHYYYPYMNLKGYMSPLVAVRFLRPKPGIVINMECRAWAKNILYKSNSQVREGSVHFEIQVDEFR